MTTDLPEERKKEIEEELKREALRGLPPPRTARIFGLKLSDKAQLRLEKLLKRLGELWVKLG